MESEEGAGVRVVEGAGDFGGEFEEVKVLEVGEAKVVDIGEEGEG